MSTKDLPGGAVAIPKGHRVLRYQAPEQPGLRRTASGLLIAGLGTAGDEPDRELSELIHGVEGALREAPAQARIVQTGGPCRPSDLFAPSQPRTILVRSPIQWVFHRGIADSLAADPRRLQALLRQLYKIRARRDPPVFQAAFLVDEPASVPLRLAGLFRVLGLEVRQPEDDTGTLLLEVERPEGYVLSALMGSMYPPPAASADATLWTVNQKKDRAEAEGDQNALQRLESEERDALAKLFAGVGDTEIVRPLFRSPRLCRMFLELAPAGGTAEAPLRKQIPPEPQQPLWQELLERDAPLFFMKDPYGNRMDLRSFDNVNVSNAFVVYSDLRCLRWAAENMGVPPGAFVIAGMIPRKLFKMAAARSLGVAIFAYEERAPTKYLVLPPDAVRVLALGVPPNENQVGASDHLRIEPAGRRLQIALGGMIIVSTERALVMHEKGLPSRYYVPREDVRAELRESAESGKCPWKGRWHCLHVSAGRKTVENGAWRYFDPSPECDSIRDYVGFFPEKMDAFGEFPVSRSTEEPAPCPCGSGLAFSRCHGADAEVTRDDGAEAERLFTEASRLYDNDELDAAIPLAERALAIMEEVHGPEHRNVVRVLDLLSDILQLKGDDERREPLVRRALAIQEKALGAEHPEVAKLMDDLAVLYSAKGEYEKAASLCQRALAVKEKALGPGDPSVAVSLCVLARVVSDAGDLDQAVLLCERALAIQERSLGPEHPAVGNSLRNLARLHRVRGAHERAAPLFQRAAAVLEKSLGPEHPAVSNTLRDLADLYYQTGNYVSAAPVYQRVLTLCEKDLGPQHAAVAALLTNLGAAYCEQGDYVRAEPLLRRALAARESALGPHHPEVGRALNNLAQIYSRTGDYIRAEPLLQRAVALLEQKLGPRDPLTADALGNLAWLYWAQRDYARAEPLFQRALAIKEEALGTAHPQVALLLNNLAEVYCREGDHERAEPLYQRALTIVESALGAEHPDMAVPLKNLAFLYEARRRAPAAEHVGDSLRAESLYRRALSICERTLGSEHPEVAVTLNSLARLYADRGDISAAAHLTERAFAIEEHNAGVMLTTGSDEQKRVYMDTFAGSTNWAISLHVEYAPAAKDAASLALATILRRKGRVLDAMAGSVAALRRRLTAEDQALLDDLRAASAELSAFMLRGLADTNLEGYHGWLAHLHDRHQALEAEVSRRSAEARAELRPVTVEQVRSSLPEGSALVELILRYPTRSRKRAEPVVPRYVAYVLQRDGEIAWTDLGDAAVIDAAAERLYRALAGPCLDHDQAARDLGDAHDAVSDPRAAGRELDSLVMQPIRRLLGSARGVFLSPDGVLNYVPFGSLLDEEGRYLVERYTFTYLASGRDLVRLTTTTPSRQDPVVIAAPDYSATTAAPAIKKDHGAQRAAELRDMHFNPLHFAAEEGRAVACKLPGAVLLTGEAATESAVKALGGPLVLHIATHGFFLPDLPTLRSPPTELDVRRNELGGWVPPPRHIENPLVRAGLALAGANDHRHGGEDGVLTALELSQVDLIGTKLVVLSACQTGIGESRRGDGVYGLRRAVALAGAETQVMSLWSVDDAATSELMRSYYDRLLAGGGRSEALRQAQLAMMNRPARAHPFYWAGFIVSGNPAALDGAQRT